jgi:hypothetical protein
VVSVIKIICINQTPKLQYFRGDEIDLGKLFAIDSAAAGVGYARYKPNIYQFSAQ